MYVNLKRVRVRVRVRVRGTSRGRGRVRGRGRSRGRAGCGIKCWRSLVTAGVETISRKQWMVSSPTTPPSHSKFGTFGKPFEVKTVQSGV